MLFRGLASGFAPLDLWQNHHVFPAWPHVLEKLLGDAGFQIEEHVTLDGWTFQQTCKYVFHRPHMC